MGKVEWGIFAIAVFAILALFIVPWFWGEWVQVVLGKWETESTVTRNVGLIVAAVLAVPFVVWRSRTADKQAAAAQNQVSVANEQTRVANQTLLNAQYQNATEMLGSATLAIRLGGIHQLERIAREHATEYHVPVMKQLCSFVRYPTEVEGQPTLNQPSIQLDYHLGAIDASDFADAWPEEIQVIREDIEAAIKSIASCHAQNLNVETAQGYWLDLHGAVLTGSDLSFLNLSRAPIEIVESINPVPSTFTYRYTDLRGAQLRWAKLQGTNLSNVDLSWVSGLTQGILNQAFVTEGQPPLLKGSLDRETRERLEWKFPVDRSDD